MRLEQVPSIRIGTLPKYSFNTSCCPAGVFTDRLRKSIQRNFSTTMYLIWWVRLRVRGLVVVRVWVTVGAMVMVGVGLVGG